MMARRLAVVTWSSIVLLIGIVLVFATITDTPLILAGQTPVTNAFEANYVRYAGLAYAHIIPGVVHRLDSKGRH